MPGIPVWKSLPWGVDGVRTSRRWRSFDSQCKVTTSAESICSFLCALVRFKEIYSPPELGGVPGGRGGLRSALPLATTGTQEQALYVTHYGLMHWPAFRPPLTPPNSGGETERSLCRRHFLLFLSFLRDNKRIRRTIIISVISVNFCVTYKNFCVNQSGLAEVFDDEFYLAAGVAMSVGR